MPLVSQNPCPHSEGAQGHFPWKWLRGGWVGFLPHSQPLTPPSHQAAEEQGASQKTPVLKEGLQGAWQPSLHRARGCLGLNEGDLWKILSHNRRIFQASLAALV